MSPISSRNRVPPLPCSNLPMRRRSAPVKAPFSWPNSSLSSSVSGMAAQLRARNGALALRAVLVDGPGHQLLAGAALAGDQHRDVLGGDAADGLVDLLHGRAAADDGFARLGRRPAASAINHGRLAHQPGDLQRLADHAVAVFAGRAA